MLLHGCEAHRVTLCQRRHAVLVPDGHCENVAPSAISEGMKDAVYVSFGFMSYNHLVVC